MFRGKLKFRFMKLTWRHAIALVNHSKKLSISSTESLIRNIGKKTELSEMKIKEKLGCLKQ